MPSCQKSLNDDHLLFRKLKEIPVIPFSKKELDSLMWDIGYGKDSGFEIALKALIARIPDVDRPSLEVSKEMACHYFVSAPVSFSDSTLTIRSWLYGICCAINQGGKDLFTVSFPHIETITIAEGHVSISSDNDDSHGVTP